ncbi:acyl-CoA dehydrogenase family protein [Amycolatopsis umgeniensis]|uniref:Alkylation response protein AidB-like acyl-CoA dehydrogenase n=1 Tax=Amycolatopsis umgeniensis TaxID=336628 RepID=A0A841BFB8_9PSEU|nr:acyl-CoA dehydrogenase family protein [Amycolatopsis umgeniensis]MBB5857485.1 alkylation response protein AidB-like acyl-CoA dehydrogenase [Amycolatopsis umgeniensis]
MTFTDPLADQFRLFTRNALRGRDLAEPERVLLAVADAGCFDFELPAEYGGLDLGLSPAAAVFYEIGALRAPISAVDHTAAALDALTSAGGPAEVADELRAGKIAYPEPSGDAFASPWWYRRLTRHAAYLAGLADAGYRAAVAHARQRTVGGVPLLSRQLVASRCVRLLGEVRLASAACRAAAGQDEPDETKVRRAHDLARATALTASRDLIQLLGAKGLTELSEGPDLYRLVHREAHRLTPQPQGES